MYSILKPFLFLLNPETAHRITVIGLRIVLKTPLLASIFRARYTPSKNRLQPMLWGIQFPNAVGLAAGFDKDGKYYNDMAALGFGFIEIGTVTPKPQNGNPSPRLFRLPADHALINRMGFNNDGVEAMVKRLQQPRPKGLIIGGNIGKNKDTPNELAHQDYLICFEALFDYVDYFVVNVSSPNTPNLRQLQEKEPLTRLLQILQDKNKEKTNPKPILLKIAPDLNNAELLDIIQIVQTTQTAGIIATNTTISRSNLQTPDSDIAAIGAGGLSGAPLRQRSTEVIRFLHQHSQGSIPIIAVGGIASPADAKEKLSAGAVLVQLYSGLVYEGPSLVKRIVEEL